MIEECKTRSRAFKKLLPKATFAAFKIFLNPFLLGHIENHNSR